MSAMCSNTAIALPLLALVSLAGAGVGVGTGIGMMIQAEATVASVKESPSMKAHSVREPKVAATLFKCMRQ